MADNVYKTLRESYHFLNGAMSDYTIPQNIAICFYEAHNGSH